ncbi:YadA-like family protein [Lelliottia aquatilis]|uniref:YadA-like family protein n=1 Tax=Lelliottia aquatilis TaxID=2080838 RepID=UPI00192AABB0|nr:YadA C-terminal domain-containing protein [Lelliottia aquatilis]MBL5883052.1 YadA-like family protein [Lelliottia aquatilis]
MLARKTAIALFVLSMSCAGSALAAPVIYDQAWGDSVEAAHQANVDLINDHQSQITQNKVNTDRAIEGLNSHINSVDNDLNSTKDAVLVVNNDLQQTKADLDKQINSTKTTANQQTASVDKDLQHTKTDLNSKIHHVQTTATQQSASVEQDLQQTKTDVNKQMAQVQNTVTQQSANVAKDLQDAKQFFNQQQASSNSQFKNLKDEVDDNKKESRSGAASAIAIASMPQVEAGQSVMFSAGAGTFKDEQALSVGASFHAGASTVIKAGVSDSTNNDFAMGAGIGIGF